MISKLKNKSLSLTIAGNPYGYGHYKRMIILKSKLKKKNYLASNLIFICTFHDKKIIDLYIQKLDPILKKISFFEKNKIDVSPYIRGGVCHKTFQRLND
jgi:glutamate-1-semialdehyde 2,1-aminomutase